MCTFFCSTNFLWIFFGYLSGSIPYGLLLTQGAGLGDVRAIGSGNIGATNVLRTGHKGVAATTLLLDALKGFVPVFLASYYAPNMVYFVALAAILGHIFPLWLHFKGGKGVATTLGVFYALSWPAALVICLLWLGIAKIFRISSLSALVAFAAAPVIAWFMQDTRLTFFSFGILLLILWTHRSNIQRLLRGEEKKV